MEDKVEEQNIEHVEGQQAEGSQQEGSHIDAAILEEAFGRFRLEQNFFGGIGVGFLAALIGAGVWAFVTALTGYQIGWMAVGVGFLVGFAVRIVGKGIDQKFGIAGALLALLGCLLGNLFTVCYFVADAEGIGFFQVLSVMNPSIAIEFMTATFSVMDILFYGIAVYEGYQIAFRKLSHEELEEAAMGGRAGFA